MGLKLIHAIKQGPRCQRYVKRGALLVIWQKIWTDDISDTYKFCINNPRASHYIIICIHINGLEKIFDNLKSENFAFLFCYKYIQYFDAALTCVPSSYI